MINSPLADASFLYVEDDPNAREVMQIIFQKVLGITRYACFEDTRNLITNIGNLPYVPDVILQDIQISPYSGYEAISMVRSVPRYRGIKVVAISASVSSLEVPHLQAAGFHSMISKPVKKAVLVDFLARIIEGENIWYTS